jgi:hypothetical protein
MRPNELSYSLTKCSLCLSISSAKIGMDNFTKTRDDSIYQRGNDPLNLIDQHVSIKSMTAMRESNSTLNVTNNPENNNPTYYPP